MELKFVVIFIVNFILVNADSCLETLPEFTKPSYNFSIKDFLGKETFDEFQTACNDYLNNLKNQFSYVKKKFFDCPEQNIYKNRMEQLTIEIFIAEFLFQLDDQYRNGKNKNL